MTDRGGGPVELVETPAGHHYRRGPTGMLAPSVTTVLRRVLARGDQLTAWDRRQVAAAAAELGDAQAGIEAAARARAAAMDDGARVHAEIAAALTVGPLDEPVAAGPQAAAARRTLEMLDAIAWECETAHLDDSRGYGGTVDLVFATPRQRGVADWKTTAAAWPAASRLTEAVQVAAYAAIPSVAATEGWVVRVDPDGRVCADRVDLDACGRLWDAVLAADAEMRGDDGWWSIERRRLSPTI